MTNARIAALALGSLALAACGGQAASEFQDAAPSYAALAMDLDTSATSSGTMGMAPMAKTSAAASAPLDCPPHLFLRAEGLAARVNRHLWKFLRRIENVSARHPDRLATGHASWHRTQGMVEIQWTITRESGPIFTWLLEMRPVGGSAWTAIFSGRIDRTGASGPHQGSGDARLDLTALHALTGEPSTGLLTTRFETFADHRQVVVDATGVVWDATLDPAAADLGSTPRNAHYVYFRAPGKGGSFKAHDEMVFFCPAPNTGLLPAEARVLARWYRTAAGTVNGRSDALMVGGQLLPTHQLQGVVCHAGPSDGMVQAENYWMMKEEDGSGATVQAWTPAGLDPSSCDAVFGAVPDPAGSASDFDFAAVNFDDDSHVKYPGEP